MMKTKYPHILIMALALNAVLTACSGTENIAELGLPAEDIVFEEPVITKIAQRAPSYNENDTATRGALVASGSSVTRFGVSASVYPTAASYTSYGIGSYFHNIAVVPNVNTEYYWPEGDKKMAFYAYYPYGDSNYRLTSEAAATGNPTYTVTVPAAIASQKDFMTAQVTNRPVSVHTPVIMAFSHQMASLRFVITNNMSKSVTVKNVIVTGVYYNGTLNGTTWQQTGSINSSGNNSFSLTVNKTVSAGASLDATGTEGIFLMIPQQLTENTKVTVITEEDSQLVAYETNITGTWEAGKTYNYNIEIKDGIRVSEDTAIANWREIKYLRFTALENGSFTLTIPASVNTSLLASVSYSTDNGVTWVTTANVNNTAVTITIPKIRAGEHILWKGTGDSYCYQGTAYSCFSSTGRFEASGNIMSLLYGDNYENTTYLGDTYTFYRLFYNCTGLTTVPELPALVLANYCYGEMFRGCTGLTTLPSGLLPAKTLKQGCYSSMFLDCTALKEIPSGFLPATTLANQCYTNMFAGCTIITTLPENLLPVTTLTNGCYKKMFENCTGLTTVPENLLPGRLETSCYANMFSGCTSLITAPSLPATTLKQDCYGAMFQNCKKLTEAPELPAETLVSSCYSYMFNGCTNLNHIQAAFTTTPSATYTRSWVSGVKSSGTFYKNKKATWSVTGANGIPTGWTVQTY